MNTKITAAMLRGYPAMMTVKDIQAVLQIGRTKAYQMLQSGEIAAIRVGRKYLIPKAYLLKYLQGIA